MKRVEHHIEGHYRPKRRRGGLCDGEAGNDDGTNGGVMKAYFGYANKRDEEKWGR